MADSGARITQEILLLAVGDDAWIRLRTGWARSGADERRPAVRPTTMTMPDFWGNR